MIEVSLNSFRHDSAVANAPLPSLRSGHLTADKREIRDFPKLPLATSFIRKPLSEIALWEGGE